MTNPATQPTESYLETCDCCGDVFPQRECKFSGAQFLCRRCVCGDVEETTSRSRCGGIGKAPITLFDITVGSECPEFDGVGWVRKS
jgi:hypothetical protein